jgi:DHA1 family bicyclomycin/chloramphenicol resistance-like MFS transporter
MAVKASEGEIHSPGALTIWCYHQKELPLLQAAITKGNTRNQYGSITMLVFVALLTAFPMLSTDLYLPAVPSIQEQLNTTVGLVNSTLVTFFIFVSISTLICGPLSDRFGRKPVLVFGVTLFFFASIACMLSTSIYALILSRAFQAFGAGAGMAISSAIVKDFFPPDKKEKAFALIGALIGVVPVVAPVVGAQLLKCMSWRGSFAALALVGLVTLVMVLFYKETHLDLSTDRVPDSILRLFVVLKNPSFARLIALFSLTPLPVYAYVGVSAILYIQGFGLTEQQFSLYFAANAVLMVLAAFCYIYLTKFLRPIVIITGSFILSLISGLLIIWLGSLHPLYLLVSITIGTFGFSLQRPPSINLMLEQQDKDSGSASALINSFMTFVGSFGMYFVSLEWENRVFVLGMTFLVINIAGMLFWLYAKGRSRIPKGM